jgi:flagellar basal body-associated protein FliL
MRAMKKNNIVFWILIILLLANLTAFVTVFIEFRKAKKELLMPQNHQQPRMIEELEFSKEQERVFQETKQKHRQAVQSIMKELRDEKAQIVVEFKKENYNDSLLNVYAKNLGDIYYKMQILDIEHMKEILSICDQEQKLKAKDRMLQNFIMRDMPRKNGPPDHRGGPPQGPDRNPNR